MKKQALIKAIDDYCEQVNSDELTVDNLIEFLAEKGTALKWKIVEEIAKIFSSRKQQGPRSIQVANDQLIVVESDDLDSDIVEIYSIIKSFNLVDQQIKIERKINGFTVIIESLIGL